MDANDTVCVPIDDVHCEFLALLEQHPALRRDPYVVEAFLSLLQAMSGRAPMWASAFTGCRETYTFMRGQYASTLLRNRTHAVQTPMIRRAIEDALDALGRLPPSSVGQEQDALGFLYLVCHAYTSFLDRKEPETDDDDFDALMDTPDDDAPIFRPASDTIPDDSGVIILDRFRKSRKNAE